MEPCSVKEISLDLRAEALERAVALRRAIALRDNRIRFSLGSALAANRKLFRVGAVALKEISLDLRAEALERAVALGRAVAL